MQEGFDRFQPHWASVSEGMPGQLSTLLEVQQSIDAAVVDTQRIAERAFDEPGDELTLAGERLASSLTHLRQAVTMFAGHAREAADSAERGFDESKLLASIEKWQRRYQELENEYSTLDAQNMRLQEASGQVMLRVERSIDAIDMILEEAEEAYGEAD